MDRLVDLLRQTLREKHILAGMAAILAVRLLYIWLIAHHAGNPLLDKVYRNFVPGHMKKVTELGQMVANDSKVYHRVAAGFADRCSLEYPSLSGRTDIVAPGFPLFLGIIYFISGKSVPAALLALSCLDALTALLVILFFRQAVLGMISKKRETVFFLLFACNFVFITYFISIKTESLFAFLITMFLVLIPAIGQKGRTRDYAWPGIVLGLATLTRPIAILFPLWLLGWRTVFPGSASRSVWLKRIGLMGGVMVLTIAPWTIRNYVKYSMFVPVSYQPWLVSRGTDLKSSAGEDRSEGWEKGNYEIKRGKRSAVQYYLLLAKNMVTHPFGYIRLWTVKLARLWFNVGYENGPSAGSVLIAFFHLAVIACTVLGLRMNPCLRTPLAAAAILVGYVTFFHVVFFPCKIRFILPFMPIWLGAAVLASGRICGVSAGGIGRS